MALINRPGDSCSWCDGCMMSVTGLAEAGGMESSLQRAFGGET